MKKITQSGNYIFVVDLTTGLSLQEHKSRVTVSCQLPVEDRTDTTIYVVSSPNTGTFEMTPATTNGETDTPYTAATWETFYKDNTGNFSPAGGGSPAVANSAYSYSEAIDANSANYQNDVLIGAAAVTLIVIGGNMYQGSGITFNSATGQTGIAVTAGQEITVLYIKQSS